jgi:4-amino-4-deoxy-L-arabinose transferase-like glycosyltransferase
MERLDRGHETIHTTPIILLSLILLSILIRVINFIGLCGYDDFGYAHIALEMVGGRFHIAEADPRYAWRFLVTFPTSIAFTIFGVKEFSAISFPLFCSIANILITWGLGRILFGNPVGLLAAALACIFPNSVAYSTMLFPEEVLSFFVGLSFLFFLLTETNRLRPSIGYLLCGFFITFSYMTRETGLFLIPIMLFWSWQRRGISLAHIGLIIPMLLYAMFELSLSYYITGDFSTITLSCVVAMKSNLQNSNNPMPGVPILKVFLVAIFMGWPTLVSFTRRRYCLCYTSLLRRR